MEGKIRLLIVDDQEVVREGLRVMLATDEDVTVVGEAAHGEEAVAQVEQLHPHVVLMDVRMPGMAGIEATRLIKEKHPDIAVIMLTVYDNDAYVVEAVKAGAAGYLLKDVSRDLLCHTIHAVRWGGTLMKGDLLKETLRSFASSRAGGGRGIPGLHADILTPREMEVLALIVEGMANKEIARALSIAEDTVKKHVQSVIAKLEVSDRTQAAVKAIREGLAR